MNIELFNRIASSARLSMHIEVKPITNTPFMEYGTQTAPWLHYAAPAVLPDPILYELLGFGSEYWPKAIPGLGPCTPISQEMMQRGLPKDISDVTRISFNFEADQEVPSENINNHLINTALPSYIMKQEISQLRQAYCDRWTTAGREFDELPSLEDIIRAEVDGGAIDVPLHWEDVRIVYWFTRVGILFNSSENS